MKTGNLIKSIVPGLLAVLLISLGGCQKQDDTEYGSAAYEAYPERLTAEQEQLLADVMGKFEEVRFYDEQNDVLYNFNIKNRNFDFGAPGEGYGWTTSDGYGYFADGDGAGFVVIGFGGSGGSSGGTVIAGSSVLNIGYTFCFSYSSGDPDSEDTGTDLFEFGIELDGVSIILGISGDFEALMDGDVDSDSEFTDFFYGFVMYIVYDSPADGDYEILDWLSNYDSELDYLDQMALAYVLDFVNEALYFSSGGIITVSGGSMNFMGEYFAITEFLLSTEDDGYDDIEASIVTGYGEMNCN